MIILIQLLSDSNERMIIKAIFEKAGRVPEPWHFEYLANKKREAFGFDKIKPFNGILDCLKEFKRHFKFATVY